MRVTTALRLAAAVVLLSSAVPAFAAQSHVAAPVVTTEAMHEILARPGVLAALEANATARQTDGQHRLKDWEKRLLEAYWRFQDSLTVEDPIATGSINP